HDHEYEHDEHCTCGCHDHDHEHHHHADEVFTSWGMETPRKFSQAEIQALLGALEDEAKYGAVLRAKGIVDASDGEWIYFDYVPGESDIRRGNPAVTGRFCVIGSGLKEDALKELFHIE
ncbi:MAG: GTP-binding protein, partial [bacterium]|nr:GTP-binding protein [bacterium]